MIHLSVAAVDVGALVNIGWWHRAPSGETLSGRDLDGLVDIVARDLISRVPVALGFEAPLFIPRPAQASALNRQRVGERGRPWCAGAGTGALALGLQQASYVFSALARQARPRVSFDLHALQRGDADLLVWEAFVSGKAKDRSAEDPHIDDARRAVDEFVLRLRRGDVVSDIVEVDVLNTAASGLLASGLTDNVALLTQPCIVVKPRNASSALDRPTEGS